MDKNNNNNSKGTQDQVQAIYLAQANIFAYEARKSKKSWIPLCDSTVPISILYDNTRSIYRIISVDADIKEVVVNTTVIPELEFVKTTQKFGYWKDVGSGRVFGIGFASEFEAEAFAECLRKIKQNMGPASQNSSFTINGCSNASQQKNNVANKVPQGQGQGDGLGNRLPFSNSNNFGGGVFQSKINRENYEQIGQAVLTYLSATRQAKADERPQTYVVEPPRGLNTSSTSTIPPAPPSQTQSKLFTTNLDELRANPGYQLPPYHHLNYPYFQQQLASPLTRPPPASTSATENTIGTSTPPAFCYQGTQVRPTLPPETFTTDTGASPVNYGDLFKTKVDFGTLRRDIQQEINRMKAEEQKLPESRLESGTGNPKKFELHVNSLNSALAKTVADLITNLEKSHMDAKQEEFHRKEREDIHRKEYQARIQAEERESYLREIETMLKRELADKFRVESIMKHLEEELKRQQQINEEQQTQINYLKELGEVYKKSYAESQRKIGELLREDENRQNVISAVIQNLMNINNQIKVNYEK